jgi:hypothetical protein
VNMKLSESWQLIRHSEVRLSVLVLVHVLTRKLTLSFPEVCMWLYLIACLFRSNVEENSGVFPAFGQWKISYLLLANWIKLNYKAPHGKSPSQRGWATWSRAKKKTRCLQVNERRKLMLCSACTASHHFQFGQCVLHLLMDDVSNFRCCIISIFHFLISFLIDMVLWQLP